MASQGVSGCVTEISVFHLRVYHIMDMKRYQVLYGRPISNDVGQRCSVFITYSFEAHSVTIKLP